MHNNEPVNMNNKKIPMVLHIIAATIALIALCCMFTRKSDISQLATRIDSIGVSMNKRSVPVVNEYKKEVEDVLHSYERENAKSVDRLKARLKAKRTGFDAVRNSIPTAVEPYRGMGPNCKLVMALAGDKISATDKSSELIQNDFASPIFTPALETATALFQAYDEFEAELKQNRDDAATKLGKAAEKLHGKASNDLSAKGMKANLDAMQSSLQSSVGTIVGDTVGVAACAGIEAVCIRSTVKSIVSLCSRLFAKAVARTATSAIAPAADGPLPVGDIIAVGLTAWTIVDIYAICKRMPKELATHLENGVNEIEIKSVESVTNAAESTLEAYNSEIERMRAEAMSIVRNR